MIFNPYLNFKGNAEEAFRFYQSVFGGKLLVQKMNDAPGMEHLSEGGIIEIPLEDMFWGDYFGSFKDKYGVCWMINYTNK